MIFRTDNTSLAIDDSRLILTLRKNTMECLAINEKIAIKILELLPYTPINAIGVNFVFNECNPGAPLLDMFNCDDNPSIGAVGWDTTKTVIKRKLESAGSILNLTLDFDGNDVNFEANFHCQMMVANSSQQAIEFISGKTEELYKSFMLILNEAYGLEYTEGADGS